jgi:hypothetical protein
VEYTQGGEKGIWKWRGTMDRKRKARATEDGQGEGKAKGKRNGKRKGVGK